MIKESTKNVHATDDVGDGFRDAIVSGRGITLAAFIKQLNKLGRKPTSQAVQLTDPAVVVFLRYDLHQTCTQTSQQSCRSILELLPTAIYFDLNVSKQIKNNLYSALSWTTYL